MATRIKMDTNFTGMEEIARKLKAAGRGSRSPSNEFVAMYKKWGVRYSAFVRRRFVKFSRGGGNWAPLKASTKKARRGKGGLVAILRDTGTLFGALTIGSPGNVGKNIPNGYEFGFGGGGSHPEGRMTIVRLAEIHQKGARSRNIPARPIIVQPDSPTNRGMLIDVKKAFNRKWGRGLSGTAGTT